ncbi:MAG: response regulator [Pirellulales bacterium]|nr:response regulator [Pirellulales bacterium]
MSTTEPHKRILVAEDNVAMLGVIRYNLDKAGFDVTTAKTGQTAWDLLQQDTFDLLITDFQMPGLTGGEVCERIRRDPRLAQMPVFLLTAKGLELDEDYYLRQLSVGAIITKPFSPRELVQTVQSCFVEGVVRV